MDWRAGVDFTTTQQATLWVLLLSSGQHFNLIVRPVSLPDVSGLSLLTARASSALALL